MTTDLTHFDENGAARMVDVSGKAETARVAIAKGAVRMAPETLAIIQDGRARKGDVAAVARLAGIIGAKKTPDLIPLCHPIQISNVAVEIVPDPDLPGLQIEASVKTNGQTGVEMEAMTAVSVTALTIYDMVKAVDKSMILTNIRLSYKDGGQSGAYREK